MSFQDELSANYRTKEDVEIERKEQRSDAVYKQAKETIESIKRGLIHEAHEGKTFIENGQKKVCDYYIVPFDCLSKKVERIEAKWGTTFFWNKPVMLSPGSIKTIFDVKQTEKLDQYMKYLREIASLEDIEVVKLVLCHSQGWFGSYHYDYYDLPYTLNEALSTIDFSWHISVKFQTTINNKHGNKKIVVVTKTMNQNENYINIDDMEGHDFERFCAKVLLKNGFDSVDVTRGSGDQGVDIIAIRDGVKYGIQCKCYSSDIGNSAIQEVFAGKSYYKCHVGVVLTNRFFTRSAKELAEVSEVLLWDRKQLLKMIEKAGFQLKDATL